MLWKAIDLQTQYRKTAANWRLVQWRVTWLNEHSTSPQSQILSEWCIDSFTFGAASRCAPKSPLRQAPKLNRHNNKETSLSTN
jgi:hypothetical protein